MKVGVETRRFRTTFSSTELWGPTDEDKVG